MLSTIVRQAKQVSLCFLKVGSVVDAVTHAGRLFQRRGAATPKVRTPAVESRDLRNVQISKLNF